MSEPSLAHGLGTGRHAPLVQRRIRGVFLADLPTHHAGAPERDAPPPGDAASVSVAGICCQPSTHDAALATGTPIGSCPQPSRTSVPTSTAKRTRVLVREPLTPVTVLTPSSPLRTQCSRVCQA